MNDRLRRAPRTSKGLIHPRKAPTPSMRSPAGRNAPRGHGLKRSSAAGEVKAKRLAVQRSRRHLSSAGSRPHCAATGSTLRRFQSVRRSKLAFLCLTDANSSRIQQRNRDRARVLLPIAHACRRVGPRIVSLAFLRNRIIRAVAVEPHAAEPWLRTNSLKRGQWRELPHTR